MSTDTRSRIPAQLVGAVPCDDPLPGLSLALMPGGVLALPGVKAGANLAGPAAGWWSLPGLNAGANRVEVVTRGAAGLSLAFMPGSIPHHDTRPARIIPGIHARKLSLSSNPPLSPPARRRGADCECRLAPSRTRHRYAVRSDSPASRSDTNSARRAATQSAATAAAP